MYAANLGVGELLNDFYSMVTGFYEALPLYQKLLILVAVLISLHMVFRLFRSSEVDKNGKVHVKYYPPSQWPRRYSSHMRSKRTAYSEKQRNWLSIMYRGKSVLQAVAGFMFGILLLSAGIFLFLQEPHLLYQLYPWTLTGAGILSIAASVWIVRNRSFDDPFAPPGNNSESKHDNQRMQK